MDVGTSWLYLYLLFILPPVLLVSLILKDRMRSLVSLPGRHNRIERPLGHHDRAM